jgi:uncharacterized repeat protein (TIGR03803 family)
MTKPRTDCVFSFARTQCRKLILPKLVCAAFVFCIATAIASPAQTFTSLLNLDKADGAFPLAGLVQGTDGNLYGTTASGGTGVYCIYNPGPGCGTIFKITAAGSLTTLYNFCSHSNCIDGLNPYAPLVQAPDGNFYGTTDSGGAKGSGTVFKMTPEGTLTTLYSFCSQPNCVDGFSPGTALVQATDGNFYGTTSGYPGTVFEITPEGTLTTLYTFGGHHGYLPLAGLVQATDGNFYGTTSAGGAVNYGTVFKITPEGALTTLHSFDGDDGEAPYGGLVEATNGNLYGTTSASSKNHGYGTVFEITLTGKLTTIHVFDGSDGNSYAGLIQATDGNFYGTTDSTALEITPAGMLSTLHVFCTPTDCAAYPLFDGLVQATNGNFYGKTFYGGSSGNCGSGGCGTIFSISVGLGPFVETRPISGQIGTAVVILGNNLTGTTAVTFNGTSAAFTVVSSTEITASVPAGATSGTVEVTTPGGTLDSNVKFRVTPQ